MATNRNATVTRIGRPRGQMSAVSKAQQQERSAQAKVVRRYLEALEASTMKQRGPRRTLEKVDAALASCVVLLSEPLTPILRRLEAAQRYEDLTAERERLSNVEDLTSLEAEFVAVAASYAAHHGISRKTWANFGVPAPIIRKAGL